MTDPAAASPELLTLRGHHFLCSLHYQGAGYSAAFTDNFTALMQQVQTGAVTRVRVAPMADAICQACPSLQSDQQSCEFQASVMRRDRALLDAMDWQPGQEFDLEEAHLAVLARREALMAEVCPGCEWLPRCQEKGPYGLASPLRRRGASAEVAS